MTQSTELAKVSGTALASVGDLGRYLKDRRPQLQAIARNNLNAEQIARTVLMCVQENAKLQACSCNSVYKSLVQALELGLQVGPGLGEAYLVPFYDSQVRGQICQFMPGYKGISTLAYRSGVIDNITMVSVYESDEFEVDYSKYPMFTHKPNLRGSRDDNDIWCVYCLIHVRGSDRVHFEYMNRAEIEKVRQNAPSKDSPAWRTWWGEMAKKTVLKRACKPLPKSPDLAKAIAWDTAVETRNYKEIVPFESEGLEELPMLSAEPERSGAANVERAATDAAVKRAKAFETKETK